MTYSRNEEYLIQIFEMFAGLYRSEFIFVLLKALAKIG
jgi:hypothetical protein